MRDRRSTGAWDSRGFTLVELVVVAAVVGIAAALLYGIFGSLYKSWVSEGLKSDMRQNVRVALDTVSRDLQMAGYQTTGYGDVNKTNLAITLAAPEEIEFDQHWLDIGTGVYEPRMVYYHVVQTPSTGRKTLYRQLRTQPGIPGTDQIVAENIHTFTLTYFDEDGNEIASPSIPASYTFGNAPPQALKDIRRICVSVSTELDREPPTKVQQWDRSLALSTCVTPRNLGVEESVRDDDPPCVPANLMVRDTTDCQRKLCVSWDKCSDPDLAGYAVYYGPGRIKRVQVTALANPDAPQILLNGPDVLITKNANRLTSPNQYNVSVAAFDTSANYSNASAPVTGNPSTDLTSCGGGSPSSHDTTVNPARPSPPESLTVAPGAEYELVVSWEPPADGSANVGYRLYRSETPYADGHIPLSARIADETTLQAGESAYTYRDPDLVGCRTYYYAVASVNCDETLVDTYLYSASGPGDYAVASGEPEDTTPPPPAPLAGTTAGWKRIFVNFDNPTLDETPDFDRTEIYFNEGDVCPTLENGTVANGNLVPDTNDPPLNRQGVFSLAGSQTFVFDSPSEASPSEPELTNQAQYCILTVVRDQCGNTAVDSSSVLLIDLCGDDPPGPPPEWPINPTYKSCDTRLVRLTWQYPPKFYTGPDQVYDFAGYRIWRTGPGQPGPIEILATEAPKWTESWTDSYDIQEGGSYRYTIRATDCVYENRHSEFPTNYSAPLYVPSDTGWIQPGRIRPFGLLEDPAVTGGPFVATHSDGVDPLDTASASPEDFTYHNNVRFYLENTSVANMTIEDMSVIWSNPNVELTSIVIGGFPATTPLSVIPTGGVPSGTPVTVNVQVKDGASGPGLPSVPIPVSLRFANFDGSVNRFTDMRSELLYVSSRIRNNSLQQSSCDPEEFLVVVPQGPVLGGYVQDWPQPFGANCYEVTGKSGSARDDDLEVPALTDVNVNGIALDTSFLDFERLSVVTSVAPVAPVGSEPGFPSGGTPQELPLQRLFGDNFAVYDEGTGAGDTLPLANDEVVWYYVLAVDETGNFDRFPNPDYGACAYYQKPSDACSSRPEPPVLSGASTPAAASLSWTAPDSYVDGSGIPMADTLLYDVYISADGGNFSLAAPGLDVLAYTHTADLTAGSYTYAVVAKNSCTDGPLESDFSNPYQECEGESGINCDSFTVPPVAEIGFEIGVSARNICEFAANGTDDTITFSVQSSLETVDFPVTEVGDNGTFMLVFTTTTCDAAPQTLLAEAVSASGTVIPLVSTECFPSYGTIRIGSEEMSYSSIRGGSLTGVVRGVSGSPTDHAAGSAIALLAGAGAAVVRVSPSDAIDVDLVAGGVRKCKKTISVADPCATVPLPPDPFDIERTPGNREAIITWGRPLFNTDGSALTDLAGYEIEFSICTSQGGGTCPEYSIYETLTLRDPNVTTFTATDLQSARQGFKMRAFDTCEPTPNYSEWTEFIRRN